MIDINTRGAKDISKVGIVLRPLTPKLKDTFLNLQEQFTINNIEVKLESQSAQMIGMQGEARESLYKNSDIIISIGGDGTLISIARNSIGFDTPILGINVGKLGFLTAITLNELPKFIEKLKNRQYYIAKQMALEGELYFKNKSKKVYCVNEFIISKQNIAGMVKIIAKINGKHFNTYVSDGLIIATPAGSTAYNISAGGAVVYPYNRNILLTPICAHSLTQKPLILNDEFKLEFELQDDIANIIIDGQEVLELCKGDIFSVKAHSNSVSLIYDENRNYFEVLREKFNWGLKDDTKAFN